MKRLFTIDLKNYNPNGKQFRRPSVRGIILDGDNNIAMVYSQKEHYYKFPGGGIENDETHLEALSREIKEETGMTIIPDSVKEFGEVLRIQRLDDTKKDVIFIQQNFYYTCKTKDKIGKQSLDDKEKELGFILKLIPIKEAINTNANFKSDDPFKNQTVEREKQVLEKLYKSIVTQPQ